MNGLDYLVDEVLIPKLPPKFVDSVRDMIGGREYHDSNKKFKAIFGTSQRLAEYNVIADLNNIGPLKDEKSGDVAKTMKALDADSHTKIAIETLVALRNAGVQMEYGRIRQLSHGLKNLTGQPAEAEPLTDFINTQDNLKMKHEMNRDFKNSPYYRGYRY